ncbi:40S ribosomal protein [Musa troglodytarum]|uniref:40S ribosomal protein n=1 Tax=Musa troglodytarum TaxID=320322 RepID=A0A9E7GE82_9LILI|nr:40S ribosomal protein [Musa troglodytarum]
MRPTTTSQTTRSLGRLRVSSALRFHPGFSAAVAAMGRMHSRGKGISSSALPYKRTPPSWLKISAAEVEESICKFSKKGLTPSQIGVILRDSHGIAQVKSVTGNKILRILKAHGLQPGIPEDLYFLIKKAVAIRKHLERNKKDKDSKFRLILVESRIHRLTRYYKRTKQDQTKSTRKGKRTDKFVLHALDSSAHGAHCSQQGRSQPPSEHLVVVLDGLQALHVEVLPESPDEGIGYLVDVLLLLLRCQALCSPRLTLSHTRLSSGVSSSREQGSGGGFVSAAAAFAIFGCRCHSGIDDNSGGLRVASHGPKLPDDLETDLFLLEPFGGLDVGPGDADVLLPVARDGNRKLDDDDDDGFDSSILLLFIMLDAESDDSSRRVA